MAPDPLSFRRGAAVLARVGELWRRLRLQHPSTRSKPANKSMLVAIARPSDNVRLSEMWLSPAEWDYKRRLASYRLDGGSQRRLRTKI